MSQYEVNAFGHVYRVKVPPTALIVDLVVEVCKQAKIPYPEDHTIRVNGKNMDRAEPLRLAGFTMRSRLDLVRFTLPPTAKVTLAVQVEHLGQRYTITVHPSLTLYEMLVQLESENKINLLRYEDQKEEQGFFGKKKAGPPLYHLPVLEINRVQYDKLEELCTTTFHALGFDSGRSAIRFAFKLTNQTLEEVDPILAQLPLRCKKFHEEREALEKQKAEDREKAQITAQKSVEAKKFSGQGHSLAVGGSSTSTTVATTATSTTSTSTGSSGAEKPSKKVHAESTEEQVQPTTAVQPAEQQQQQQQEEEKVKSQVEAQEDQPQEQEQQPQEEQKPKQQSQEQEQQQQQEQEQESSPAATESKPFDPYKPHVFKMEGLTDDQLDRLQEEARRRAKEDTTPFQSREYHEGPVEFPPELLKRREELLRKQASQSASTSTAPAAEPIDRKLMVIKRKEGGGVTRAQFELPEQFYDLTANDMRNLLKHEEEEPMLMTEEMRQQKKEEKYKKFPVTVIRVLYGDLYLQGCFQHKEPISRLYEFVRNAMADPSLPFYLYVTPPVKHLKDLNQTFLDARLTPKSVVYFNFNDEQKRAQWLREELAQSAKEILLVEDALSNKVYHAPTEESSSSSSGGNSNSATSGVKKPTGAPKWFKLQ